MLPITPKSRKKDQNRHFFLYLLIFLKKIFDFKMRWIYCFSRIARDGFFGARTKTQSCLFAQNHEFWSHWLCFCRFSQSNNRWSALNSWFWTEQKLAGRKGNQTMLRNDVRNRVQFAHLCATKKELLNSRGEKTLLLGRTKLGLKNGADTNLSSDFISICMYLKFSTFQIYLDRLPISFIVISSTTRAYLIGSSVILTCQTNVHESVPRIKII